MVFLASGMFFSIHLLHSRFGQTPKTTNTGDPTVKPLETARVQAYLQDKFDTNMIRLVRRPQADDSVEVLLDKEFIGVVYRDEDEGEVSYQFHMTILEEDLPQG